MTGRILQQFNEINRMFWDGSPYQWVFYASIFLILILEKNKTRKMIFGIFSIVMLVVMFNPLIPAIFSKFFNNINLYYVRLFSVVPIFYCMAHGVVIVLDKTKGGIKCICVCAISVFIITAGHTVLREPWLREADNKEKVPHEAQTVIDAIPRFKENVCVAFPSPLNVYARQIDADLIMPYGRQMGNELPLLAEIDKAVPDAATVMEMAGGKGVDYVVINKSEEVREKWSANGYEPVNQTASYYIYPVAGVAKNERVLNDKRLVISDTELDSVGKPAYSSRRVITTYKYEYDRWGNKIAEWYYDKDDKPVTTITGYAGIKRHFTLIGSTWKVESVTYMDVDKQPTLVAGRYETRFEYNHEGEVVKESYCDGEGSLMERTDVGYAVVQREYDNNKNIVSEKYYSVSGDPIISTAGYAGFIREYDDSNRVIQERYFNSEGSIANNTAGFAEWDRAYDDAGYVLREMFYDEKGNIVDIKKEITQDYTTDLVQRMEKGSVENSVGIKYQWNDDGSCSVTGEAKAISWNSILEGDRPYYFLNGETYQIRYQAENADLRIYFYEDSSWKNQVASSVVTKSDAEFIVPQNCGAMIIRVWVAPGTKINESVSPHIFKKKVFR